MRHSLQESLVMNNRVSRFVWVCWISLSLSLSGCASSRNQASSKNQHPGVRSFSNIEKEEGLQIHQQIVSNFYLYTEPSVTEYVDKVGTSLAGSSADAKKNYDFTILYNDKIYATAAPGGHVYVTTGLLNFVENEAELAAVLAHEIAILQFQDPRASNGRKVMEGMTQAVSLVGPAFGQIGSLAALGVILLNSASQNGGVSKEEKLERADAMALRYMLHAGYDPQGLIDLLYKFLQADKTMLPFFYDYYQSYPITEERVTRLHHDFSKLPLTNRELSMRREEFLETTRGVREMYAG